MKLFLDYLFIYQPPTSVSKHPAGITVLTPITQSGTGVHAVNEVNTPMVIHQHPSVAMFKLCQGRYPQLLVGGGSKTPSTFRARPFGYLRSQQRVITEGGVNHAY